MCARGVFQPDKVSPTHEINALQLRPPLHETVASSFPPHRHPYWVAAEVLCDTGAGWTRCISRKCDAVEVPHSFEFDGYDIVLDITHS